MMILPSGLSAYSFTFDNWGANPSAAPGTSVSTGASANTEGSWTQVASSANIAQDCYWVEVYVSNGGTSAIQRNQLLDIGVDPAGGTSYVSIFENVCCGQSSNPAAASGGKHYLVPWFIKAGSSVAARVQSDNVTSTVRVAVKFYGRPSNPQNVPIGMASQTLGTITGSAGTIFTPGNAADGAWVSMGTLTIPAFWLQLCVQTGDNPMTALQTYVDLAVGDATNKQVVKRMQIASTAAELLGDAVPSNINFLECFWPLPIGAELWVRGRCSAAPDTGHSATVLAIGGSRG